MQVVGLGFYFYEKPVVGEAFLLLLCGLLSLHWRQIIGEVDDVVHSVCGEDVLAGQLILFDAQFLLWCLWTLLLLSPLLIIS
jgi:hypothetical protein